MKMLTVWIKSFLYMNMEQFKLLKGLAVVGSVMVDGVLTHCALLHLTCDLKAAKMNVQFSLIWEYSFGSIMVVGMLTHCALLHFKCDLKAAKMNVQCSLIWEFSLYDFKLGHYTMEITMNICRRKCESEVDHSTVTRWFSKIFLELQDPQQSGKIKWA